MTSALVPWLLLVPLAAPRSAAPGGSRLPTADSSQAADERKEIAALLDELSAAAVKKGKEDDRAIQLVEKLGAEYEASGPKDRVAIVKGLAAAVRSPRPRPDKKSFNDRLARAGAEKLGGCGEAATTALIGLLDDRELRKNPGMVETLLESLGRTRGGKAVPVLVDYVARRDVAAVRGAARGLQHFADADGATRKKAFEAAFKTLIYVHDELSNQSIDAPSMEDYWKQVSTPLAETLQKLSGHQENEVNGWQRWWNDNKNKDWDRAK